MQRHKAAYNLARMSQLKDRIKQARKYAELTQAELAAAIRVTQPVISQLERGESLQSVHLLKIASACAVDPAWLAEGIGEMTADIISSPADEVRQGFATRLKQAAIAAGVPERGLAARLAEITDVTPTAAGKWLNQQSMPSRENMLAIAETFSVRVEWLEYGHGFMRADAAARSSADVVRAMLEKHGKGLTDDARRKIVDAVEEQSLAIEEPKAPYSNVIQGDFSRTIVKGDTIVIAQYDIRAAMGAGQVPADYREFVRNLVVDRVQLDDLGIEYTSPTNLKVITGWGQSMRGTIEDKALLIVDIGVTDYASEGVYVFTWLDELYLKRVQVLDEDHFQLVSDNKVFEPQKARMDRVHFHAKVLGTWNFSKL